LRERGNVTRERGRLFTRGSRLPASAEGGGGGAVLVKGVNKFTGGQGRGKGKKNELGRREGENRRYTRIGFPSASTRGGDAALRENVHMLNGAGRVKWTRSTDKKK